MLNGKKAVGVLTSGGDAPGMNAAVRAVVRTGLDLGFEMIGIQKGYAGLLERQFESLHLRSVSGILQQGGTVLYSARCPEFSEEWNLSKARQVCYEAGLDAVVAIGGDGTLRGAEALSRQGVSCIGIPATIDNDVAGSSYTIGFDTAVNTIVQMVDRVRDTSQSHQRCSVIEVMGRSSGHIALYAGIACGALAILVPEFEFHMERDVLARMTEALRTGKQHFIILIAEGVGSAPELARAIHEETEIETNAVVLGHVQRGGSPSALDRAVASKMGHHAVKLLAQGGKNRVVVLNGEGVTDLSFEEARQQKNVLNEDWYQTAIEVSI